MYTPFGEMWVDEASTVDISHITRFFTNQQYDKESGLYYYNARYYDPHLGSFLTPDPAMSGLNHYAYANGNPVNYIDPTGLFTVDWSASSPGHIGDLQSDNNGHTDPHEAAYGAKGIGTGGTTDTGSSSSSSGRSGSGNIPNPYAETLLNLYNISTGNAPVPDLTGDTGVDNSNDRFTHNQDIFDVLLQEGQSNRFCFVTDMIMNQAGKTTLGYIANQRAIDTAQHLIDNSFINTDGSFINPNQSYAIENEIKTFLGNEGNLNQDWTNNQTNIQSRLSDLDDKTGYIVTPPSFNNYGDTHWWTVESYDSDNNSVTARNPLNNTTSNISISNINELIRSWTTR